MRDCSSLDEIRDRIDAVDRQIVKLVAERRGYVLQAAAFKRTGADVRAPARVEQVIAKVRALACEDGVEPELVEALYREMIARFVDLELARHRSTSAPSRR
jgi:isochorismate pyruvate lyase